MRVPGGKPFEFVRGAGDFPGWGGVHSERGRMAPPSNRPQMAINLIARGGRLVARPYEIEDYVSSWANVHGIFDLDCPPIHLWAVMNDCPAVTGGTVMTYSFDEKPEFQIVAKFWGVGGGSMAIGSFGTDVYVGENANLRLMHQRSVQYGQALQAQGDLGSRVVYKFSGTTPIVRSILEFDGSLWIAVCVSGPNYAIYQWDGATMVASTTGAGDAVSMGLWEDNLVVSFNNAGSNIIRLRSSGAGGAWSTVVPAAGSLLAARAPQTIKSYRGDLYIVDATTGIWRYNGVTLSSVHTVAGATMKALEVFNDKLFYAYDLAATCCIGEYDGTTATWTDVRKNLTTQYTYNRKIHGLCSFRGSLWAGVGSYLYSSSDGESSYYTARMVVSPGKGVAGTWIGSGSGSYVAGNDAVGPVLYGVW